MTSRKWKILIGVLTPVLLGILFVAVEHLRGKWMLNRETATLRGQGERLTVAELLPQPSPGEANGALAFIGAASLLSGRVVPEQVPGTWKAVLPGKVRLTTLSRQWPRAMDAKTTNLLTAEEIAQDIQSARENLIQVHNALRQPVLQFTTSYSLRGMVGLHLAPTKRAAQWLRAASLNALLAAELEGSLVCLESEAVLARKLADEPLLISQLVAMAIAQIGVGATWEALQSPGWTETQLARLQTAWGELDCSTLMARAMEMERAMGHDEFNQFTADELMSFTDWTAALSGSNAPPSLPTAVSDVPEFMATLVENTPKALQRTVYFPFWRAAWADQDHARLLRLWQYYIVAARKVAVSNSLQAAKAVLPAHETEIGLPGKAEPEPVGFYDQSRFLVSSMLSGHHYGAIRRACEADAWRRMAVTAVALQRYRLQHGRWPPDLTALVPGQLPAVLLDPMDGKLLRYQFKPDGSFRLYSVGADGVDDGGDARPPNPDSGSPTVQRGRDLVWPAVATAEEIAEADAKAESRRR